MGQIITAVRKSADIHDVHVDVPLSNISTAYIQSETDFIAGQVFPVVTVGKKSDRYYAFAKETFFRNRAQRWVPGTPMPQGAFDVDNTPNYSCEFRAFEFPLGWDIRDNADSQLAFDRSGTEFVTRVMLLEREVQWATTYFIPGVWGTDYTGVAANPNPLLNQFTQWDDYANSDPLTDFRLARLAVKGRTGFPANTAVMSEEVFEVLADHPMLKELFKYTQKGILSAELVAQALRVQKLVVAGAVQITSPEGAAVEAYNWIYGKRAWLGYVNPRPGLMMPSSGYIFNWRGMTQGFEVAIERHVDARAHADFVQGITCYDMRRVGADLGCLFDQAIS
jgi:hypothetical protein